MKSAKPRIIVITGAAGGFGRATAKMFAETQGAHIGLIARRMEELEGAKCDVEALGGKAIIIQGDVTDAEGMEAAVDSVERELGPIDIWVNVAMTSVFAFVKETTAAEFKWVIADDPRITNTVKIIDATLKTETATGPVWHRYTHDGYGEIVPAKSFLRTELCSSRSTGRRRKMGRGKL